jgi:VanZ family protein
VEEQFKAAASRARILCFVTVLGVLVATLWPFNPVPRNRVSWLQGMPGLKFEKASLVISADSLEPPDADLDSYTIELLLRPASITRAHTIVGFYTPPSPKQFLIRQWTDGLLVTHDARINHDKTRTIKFDVDHVFVRGELVQVTISSGPKGTTVYLDGQMSESVPQFRVSGKELSAQVVLGTSPVTYNPWFGELCGLGIYSRELTPADAFRHFREWTEPSGSPDLQNAMARYIFAEKAGQEVHNEVASGPNLEIPARFSIPHKGMLESVAKEFRPNRRYASDVLMNIAGFIPLGVIVCACLTPTRTRWNAILFTVVACGILSLGIEVLQYYIPSRGSGITDIITNTTGAAAGAVLVQMSAIRRLLERMNLISK